MILEPTVSIRTSKTNIKLKREFKKSNIRRHMSVLVALELFQITAEGGESR